MDIRLQTMAEAVVNADCLIIPTLTGESVRTRLRGLADAPAWLHESAALDDHSGKKDQITVCYAPAGAKKSTARVLLLGLGAKEDVNPDSFRLAVAVAMRRCKSMCFARPALSVEAFYAVAATLGVAPEERLAEAVLAAVLAAYRCTEYRSAKARSEAKQGDDTFFTPEALILAHGGKKVPAALAAALDLVQAEAYGICLARDLVNGPPNVITPARMAEEAQALARRHGFACRVLGRADMEKLGMGALLAVAEGSHREPHLIVLEYVPAKANKSKPLILVGKGITFDTGGISLKPSLGMHEMKGDMAGAAAVMGVFEAIGRNPESVNQPVVGLMPCVENMPGGGAARPGDIVTTLSGKTVEIINTDAEGRLILCDALSYAQNNWKPAALVDIATLTGACVVALGTLGAAVFCDDAPLREAIVSAGNENGDLFWPMPLWENLRDNLKSSVADMANVGSREGGSITAGLFLKSFVNAGTPWAHLDIAGPGHSSKETPLCTSGGTGFGVRTMYALARRYTVKSGK